MIAVVLPTWLLLCWDRLTHSILVRGFLPEVFRTGSLLKEKGVILLSYWCTTSTLQKRYLEIGFSHTLAHQLILEKPLKPYLTWTEKTRGVKLIWLPPPCLWPRQTLQAARTKIHEIIETSSFIAKCIPEVQNQWNSKGNRGISRAPSGWDSALPRQAAWCPSAVWELRWHLPPCLAKNRTTTKIHRICR